MWIENQRGMICLSLIFLISGFFCFSFSNTYVHRRMDSYSFWVQHTRHVDVTFNSSSETLKIFSNTMYITIDSFNVTGGNATIQLLDIDTVIVCFTDVSGIGIPGFNSSEIAEITSGYYRFVLSASQGGVRITFDFIEHDIMFVDSIPYWVIESGYYYFAIAGAIFLCLSFISAVLLIWKLEGLDKEKLDASAL